MKEMKEFLEIEALKSMSYKDINEIINNLHERSETLKKIEDYLKDDPEADLISVGVFVVKLVEK